MAFSYIDEKSIVDAFEESKQKFIPALEKIDEYERLARNEPKPILPVGFPNTTDGTTSSYVQSRPKSVIQQLPTGLVTSLDKDKDLAGIAGLVLTEEIYPNANTTGSVIQKSWAVMSKSMIYGGQPGYVFYTHNNRNDYYGADFKLPYVKDVILESGKVYDKDCNVIFMRAWYQPSDIKYIIHQSKHLHTGWRLKALANLKPVAKSDDSKTPAERAQNIDAGGVEIIFAFQAGRGAKFYGFSPDTGEIVYETVNPDPRGIIPIHYMYYDLDMSSPIGRGAVEGVAGLQNMLDAEMQMYQYAQALGLNPPVKKRGNFDTSTMRFQQNAIWDMGDNPNNDVSVVNISTAALQNFPNNYGLIKSQILNINNANDTSVSAEVGNPGFSKTDSGIKAQQERVGLSDNYLRKQFEDWFADISETMLNVHFALSSGDREIELTQEYIQRQKLTDPEFAATEATVHYDQITSGFRFKVDASTSKLKDDEAAVDNLKGVLELAQSDPEISRYINKEKVLKRIITKLGVDDPEELVIDPDENDNGVPDAQEQLAQQGEVSPEEEVYV